MDSFIESLSGFIIIWRFWKEEGTEEKEKNAIKFISLTFFILGFYVLYEAVKKLYLIKKPSPSIFGIAIASISIIFL